MSYRTLRGLCLTAAAAGLLSAAAAIVLLENKATGIMMLLFAAIVARVLVLNIAENFTDSAEKGPPARSDSVDHRRDLVDDDRYE